VTRRTGTAFATVDGARVSFTDGQLRVPYPAPGKTLTVHCEL